MARVITRYRGGSRKLYDTTDSRYISLDEIPEMIRRGEVLRVVDNRNGADVTAQVLAQVISESEKRGVSLLSPEALHEIIRRGERLVTTGVRYLRREMDRFANQLAPAVATRRSRNETDLLRRGLRQLEQSLTLMDGSGAVSRPAPRRRPRRVRSASAGHPIRTEVEIP
jgi:polyhydroxyalkanoate synthesis repressor PhaR